MRRRSKPRGSERLLHVATFGLFSSYAALAPALALAQGASAPPPAAATVADSGEISEVIVKGEKLAPLDISSGSSLGFDKSLLETPRTVSFVDSEQISLLGISSVDDLTRAVPGTFTTTRYGLQGGINVRGVPADMYFRGMKRINMQGHARTNLAAMDSLEVIKGPPSPIYGMGKIGGYTNMTPKSGRAVNGGYLDKPSGFMQAIGGDYDRAEMSAGVGGGFDIFDRKGGYYVYGLMENSNSYVKQVGVKQKILQGSMSVDDALGPFRLETGGQWQNSITSGAYMNRATQALVDRGQYVGGMPLAQLDLNQDGAIGFRETHLGSPITWKDTDGDGVADTPAVSSGNRPLYQNYEWPTCDGAPCAVGHFPTVAGIPQTMYDYLSANSADDPISQLMLAQGVGGPLPVSGQLPVGMVLDPGTSGYKDLDYRRNGSYERVQDAKLGMLYFDLVYDRDPDFTVKAQFFKDYLNSFKNSQLPYGEKQDIHLWEEKITATYRIPDDKLPNWLRVNSLASINYRETRGEIRSSGGDYDWRQDVMYKDGTYTPNTLFWNQLDDQSSATGAPVTTNRDSKFSEMGVGFMFDIDLFQDDSNLIFKGTNLLLGWRVDGSQAKGNDYSRFNENGSYAYYDDEGNLQTKDATLAPAHAQRWDDGTSWSASLSQQLPWGLRPYITFAKSSVTLDASNNIIQVSTLKSPGGHIGEAELREQGLKADFFGGKLGITVAHYKQTRTDVSSATDPTLSAEVSSTETKGWEGEVKWNPTRKAFISAYAVYQQQRYLFNSATTYQLDGRYLGFQDVVDPSTGAVVYPAEAFTYGGRTQVTVPTAILSQYMKPNGIPEHQYGVNAGYTFDSGIGFLLGGTYWSEVYADRLETIKLPSATVMNLAFTYDRADWHFKVNGYNVTDERYFRARNSATTPGLISVMPGARWEATVKLDF
ncbi:TonB-dependent receptor [Solimonas flava]|uniref:TonB-dependent receptor n=1 Tax=Solimonas flava TaxID=415849 RepID=UPI0004144F4C|nr:TonB-dependent receptor [Solimonas flava]